MGGQQAPPARTLQRSCLGKQGHSGQTLGPSAWPYTSQRECFLPLNSHASQPFLPDERGPEGTLAPSSPNNLSRLEEGGQDPWLHD